MRGKKPTKEDLIQRDALPIPDKKFEGKIGEDYTKSKADIPEMFNAPDGAPNILLVLLDDVGFGHASTFGGPINTPTLERLANEGLKYNRFHTTALCSPTRAALLSGRNHHSVHTGTIMELATGFPGYDGVLPKDSALIAKILRDNGYSTSAFGKWHNTPDYEVSVAGPFDRWPTGLGFDYWWGFQGGEANQWNTPLYENTSPVEKDKNDPNWHLSSAMADKAISWITQQKSAAPDKPFFLYWAPGATHAPHHVAKEWADKYKGKFDHGWDRQREITFENQKRLGIIPKDTKLTPRPDSIQSWDSCSADEKRLFARMQEVYAGFFEHVDAQIGRMVDALETMNIRDNTLIIYIVGDNGPSAEGTLHGTLNNMKSQQGFADDISTMLKHIDEIGGPEHENHYPVAWCWAGSSPFQWMKQVASHFGGTRNPVVMSWPKKIKDKGGMRSQFHHVIDIAKTLLDVANIPEPKTVEGIPQRPLEGVSMTYTWDNPEAEGRHETQYFEMLGNRAIYHKGWLAGCLHGRLPWEMGQSVPFDTDTWELYNLEEDFSQANDVVDKYPDKLLELQNLFQQEATRFNVLPLDDRFTERADASLRPNHLRGKTRMVYIRGAERIPESSSPNTKNVNHTISAEIEVSSKSEGVLACCGGESGGWTMYMKDRRLHWEHNWFNNERYRISSDAPIPEGHHIVSARVDVDKEGQPGVGGTVRLFLGEEQIGEGRFEKQIPFRYTVNETFDVGLDTVTPVSDEYESPFEYSDEIKRVMIDVSPMSFQELASDVKARIAMSMQ